MDLKDKIVLITGSSSGIGKAVAILLASKGACVIVNSRKNVEGGKEVVNEIEKNKGSAIFIQADVSKEGECELLFNKAVEKFKRIDVLVNCAGESTSGKLEEIDVWKYQFENIFMTCVNSIVQFQKHSKGSEIRKIINISSIYGSTSGGNTDFLAYSAMKAAINSLTINLAKKLAPDVLVNAVAPGYTLTPPWGEPTTELEQDIKRETKIGRFVAPEEVAEVVAMLVNNDAITGQIITVDGGTLLKDLY